jgi:uncharacterized protein (TIGR00369 family)
MHIDASPGSFDRLMGLRLTSADGDRVEAVLPITADLLQAHGIVHGGVYSAAIETCTSVGASLRAGLDQQVDVAEAGPGGAVVAEGDAVELDTRAAPVE